MWKLPVFRIMAGLVDVRAFDDEGIAFVRRNFERLRSITIELDDLEYELRAMRQMRSAFAAELLIVSVPEPRRYSVVYQGETFTCRSEREPGNLVERLAARCRIDFRMPAHEYTLDRPAEVEAIAQQRRRTDVPMQIDELQYATLPTPSEQALRRAIFDAVQSCPSGSSARGARRIGASRSG